MRQNGRKRGKFPRFEANVSRPLQILHAKVWLSWPPKCGRKNIAKHLLPSGHQKVGSAEITVDDLGFFQEINVPPHWDNG